MLSYLTESDGTVKYDTIEENLTYREISDEQTGHREKVIIDSKDKTKNPALVIETKDEDLSYNIPVGAHLAVNDARQNSGRSDSGEDSENDGQI
jgi:DNA-directed RNA polymerase subunit beta'